MKFCYITFRSVTPAQKGEKILRRAGVDCTIQRTPRWMEEQGCGYSLRLRHGDAIRGCTILREKGINFRKVYLLEDGRFEELAL